MQSQVELPPAPHTGPPMIAVWFYIGLLLGLYGLLLTAAGLYQWAHPPTTVLASYHATFWAGFALLLTGGAYTILFWPSRRRTKSLYR